MKKHEARPCPKQFQDRITRMFGKNQFGTPNFKIVWGQSEFHRMGNIWRDKEGNERKGYRQQYLCDGQPGWNILRWKSPEYWGSPDTFYRNTFDPVSGLYILGEYPWRGRYEVLYSLTRKEFEMGRLVISHFPLSHVLIDKIIPLILATQRLTAEELAAAREANRIIEERKQADEISEMMMANLPTYYGPVSFARQGMHTSLLDRKMHLIQQAWNKLSRRGKRLVFQKGIALGNRPAISGYKN
jgi:hypothetical protein